MPWHEVNRVMGYAQSATLFGFGGGSGLESISPDQFAELHAIFHKTPRE